MKIKSLLWTTRYVVLSVCTLVYTGVRRWQYSRPAADWNYTSPRRGLWCRPWHEFP